MAQVAGHIVTSKGRARRLFKQLIDKHNVLGVDPPRRKSDDADQVKGVSKRVKKIVLLSPEQAVALIVAPEEPYNLVVLVAASLGLRVEELVALQWDDFDFIGRTVITICRAFTHAELAEPKSDSLAATLPSPLTL